MVAAMRTIFEDILPFMNTSTGKDENDDYENENENRNDNDNENENDNDDGNENDNNTRRKSETETHDSTNDLIGIHTKSRMNTNTDTDTNTHSNKETLRGREKDPSRKIQNKTAQSFEFYPHISPKLADNWDFKATLEAVAFPSIDSINVAEWLKKRRKQDDLKNCVGGIPVSVGGNESPTCNAGQSTENDTNAASDGDIVDGTAVIPDNSSLVLDPLLVSTTVPTPVTVPAPTPDKPPIDPLGSLAIQMGDFTKIYGHIDQENQFDCVVTCFFIDTASDILEYLAVIAHVLREGMHFFIMCMSFSSPQEFVRYHCV